MGGAAAVAAMAERCDPASLLVVAFERRFTRHPDRVVHPDYACLSDRWAAKLERAVARLDRLAGAPVGRRRILELVECHRGEDFAGVLKALDAPTAGAAVWEEGEPVTASWSHRYGHAGPFPVSAALFAQQLHRESKVAAIRARGGRTWEELKMRSKAEAAEELHRQVNSVPSPTRTEQRDQRARARLILRAREGDVEARTELSRLLAAREDRC